ncbi:Hypothetical protein R9X50_00163000 [Acrodontium crateriforme]|uniref:Amino acid permease n=1 Tax=Acrodontium crateriforme TaxID=150365 RepID=A0AAQ3M025_9PEZI|nr:Hypothetical protein R9X50_00163000 [Acrodontium crateriforme]
MGLRKSVNKGDDALGQKVSSGHEVREDLPRYDNASATAADELAVLGYDDELVRSRTTREVTFMSFVLSSVPYGLATTLIYPVSGGGPVTIIWGWVAVSLIVFCVAISLGEITSVYPTAGGVYYQTFMLAPVSYRRILAYICGWAFTLGNIIITLSVNFGTTLFFIGCINIFHDADGNGIFEAKTYQTYLIFLAITLICNAVSALGNRWLPILDTGAIYFTFAGVIAIVCCVLAIAKEGRHSATYVFTDFDPISGWVPGWAFCVGLLHAAYATSATGMILSMCEEVKKPATQVPKAMVGTIVLNTICGLVFLIPLVFVLPDLTAIYNDPYAQPLPFILRAAIGSEAGAFALTVPIIILGIICGVGCTTAASRCTWAFARDGAIPGSKIWKEVNRSLDVPLNAMMLSMIIQLALGLIYFGSSAAFNAFNGVGVIFLTLSYVMPIAVSLLRGRRALVNASFNFGFFGVVANVISIAWCALAIPLFSMPTALPVAVTTVNYASVVFVGFMAISAAYYIVRGRHHYRGPPTEGVDEAERRESSFVGTGPAL